jgi:hypothetical protein
MLSAAFITLVLASAPAWPCVSLVHEPGELAESDGQQTIFRRDSETGDAVVEYLVQYEGDAEDFGWIIAIPGTFTGLEDGDEADFADLQDLTSPTVTYVSIGAGDDGGCGCMGGAKGGSDGLGDSGELSNGRGVDVVAEGFTGTYAFQAIEADSDAELSAWLDDNGWSTGDSGGAVAAYVNEGWTFVLLNILPGSEASSGERHTLPPVAIQYDGDMTLPARMAEGFGTQIFDGTVYVLGDQAATVSGWTSIDGTWYESTDTDPDDAWSDIRWNAGGDTPGYVRTTVTMLDEATDSDDPDVWVTRFDMRATAEAHTVDATFTLDGGTDEVSTSIELPGNNSVGAWVIVPLLSMLGLGVALRRRRDGSEPEAPASSHRLGSETAALQSK